MRNKNRPFFYDDRKKPWHKVLIFLILLIAVFFWGAMVPSVRQLLGGTVLDASQSVKSLFMPVKTLNPLDYRIETQYPTLELPSEEVMFAESLAELTGAEETPLVFAFTPTPTAGVFWVIEDQQKADTEVEIPPEKAVVQLSLPSFERQDYLNDVPASLSAVLRFYHKTENQYSLAQALKPDYFAPNLSYAEVNAFLAEKYPDLAGITRLNGDTRTLISLLQQNLPILLRLELPRSRPIWMGDDLWDGRTIVVTGYDSVSETFFYTDPLKGDQQTLPFQTLMEKWYSFAREYEVIYPVDQAEQVQQILGDQWQETQNQQAAAEKFKLDVAMVPDKVFAWLNYGRLAVTQGQDEEAWNAYKTAVQIGIPQRYLLYDDQYYQAAFNNGIAQEMLDRADSMLKINSHSEENWLWKGWAYALMRQEETALNCFRSAQKINPNSRKARYAIEFLNQYH